MTTATGTYSFAGQLLEVCDCGTLCPCWIGEDPDNGTCDTFLAYRIERGHINGVDVAGVTQVMIAHIPGNIFQGGFKVVMIQDAAASQAQRDAILAAFRGQLGGPLADLAALVGEVLDVRVASIDCSIVEGAGTITVPGILHAEMAPYRGASGEPTRLVDSIFSTIPGSPAYVAKASVNRVTLPEFGMTWDLKGKNAIQGTFSFEA